MQLKISKKLNQQNTLKDNEEKLRRLGRISSHSKQEPQSNRKFRMLYGRPSRPLRVGSLFCGIGGFEQALKLLRVRQDIVFACDSDQHVKQSYLANHGKKLNEDDWYEDVIDFAEHHADQYKNKVDLLVGGPPCQSFSIIGKHGGLNDDRGNLVFEFIEVIRKTRPRIFIFENVKGLLMINDGHAWDVIKEEFHNLGYKVDWRCLSARDYGIPQSRERLFVIGFRNNSIDYSWPKPWPLEKVMHDLLEEDTDKKYFLPPKGVKFVTNPENIKKRYTNIDQKIQSTQKANQQFNWHGDFVEVDHETYMDRYTLSKDVRDFVMEEGSGSFQASPDKDLDVARTILSTSHKMHRAGVDNYVERKKESQKNDELIIRRLTPRECLNLMGWVNKKYEPIDFKIKYKGKIMSDTQLYRQAGNSIVVWVAAQIISTLRFDQLGI
jgi:DNA (cytosine-5)-methyltransferase 1